MCDCNQQLQKRLQKEFEEKVAGIPRAVITEKIAFVNLGLSLGDSRGWFLFQPVEGRYALGKQSRKHEVKVICSYCPFCGEKQTVEDEA